MNISEMGCSPSKGNFIAHNSFTTGRMLPSAPQQNLRDFQCEQGDRCNSAGAKNEENLDRKKAGQSDTHLLPQKKRSEAVKVDQLVTQGSDNNSVSQRKEKHEDKQDIVTDKKSGRKLKKNSRGMKLFKKKDKDKPPAEQKVDFPEPLVKAHQAAYAFLNPSISKYDSLLEHLEQATQTHVFVQPMVAFMALCYDEIIQALEEMADEGENVFKEIGEHLAWPSQMKNLSTSSLLKSGSADTEPPPDLLQQLLQYTAQRMQNVSKTVGGLGDLALEEAVEYFSAVSELLEEKLKVKRVVESKLMRLLSRIEAASLRKPGPEDSALFSEDSGIGAESESLAGSERCHRRESCTSTGTNRTTPINQLEHSSMTITQRTLRQKLTSKVSPCVSLTSLNSIDSTCTLMAKEQNDSLLGSVSLDDGEEDDNDVDTDGSIGNGQVGISMNLHSSLVHSEHQPCRLPAKRIENPQNVEMTLKMKNAISGKIQFVSHPNGSSAKCKFVESPKASRHQWAEDEGQTPKRPQTAAPVQKAGAEKKPVAKGKRSRSADSLRSKGEDSTLLELERTQKDLNQKLQRMNKSKERGCTQTVPSKKSQGSSPAKYQAKKNESQSLHVKAGCTRQTNSKQETSDVEEDKTQKHRKTFKGSTKATPPPSPPLSPRPPSGLYRGRNSVKKLIDTFSQGIEVLDDANVLGPLKGVRKCGVPVLPGLGNVEAVLSTGITSCRPENTSSDKTGDLDLDSFPPPPLEVLMDNSFESAPGLSASIGDDGVTKGKKSPLVKRAAISQRLRASVQSVTVLPSKGSVPQGSKVMSPARTDQEDSAKTKVSQPNVQQESEKGKGSSFSKQARKMKHQQAPDSQSEKVSTNYVTPNPSPSQAESVDIQDDDNLPKPGSSTTETTLPPSPLSGQPHAILPMSKTRMLPTTPSTPSSQNRKLPSPQNFKKQPTSPSPPPVNRKLPTPPVVQKRQPSPPAAKENIVNSNTAHSYPFKAPSPPASPNVQRSSRSNSNEDSHATRVIRNAHSVFCPASSSIFHAQVCPVPQPPQAWTSTGVSFATCGFGNRGRFPVSIHGPKPFIRRSHSDRRPSLTLPPRSPGIPTVHSCGSEPEISTKGLEDDPNTEDGIWGHLSVLRATLRSVSHPDLCVVGQSLHKV